jgi:hypothetical protein
MFNGLAGTKRGAKPNRDVAGGLGIAAFRILLRIMLTCTPNWVVEGSRGPGGVRISRGGVRLSRSLNNNCMRSCVSSCHDIPSSVLNKSNVLSNESNKSNQTNQM